MEKSVIDLIIADYIKSLNDPINIFSDMDSCNCKTHLNSRIENIMKYGYEYASKCAYTTLIENIHTSHGICNHYWFDTNIRSLIDAKMIAEPWLSMSIDLLKH